MTTVYVVLRDPRGARKLDSVWSTPERAYARVQRVPSPGSAEMPVKASYVAMSLDVEPDDAISEGFFPPYPRDSSDAGGKS